MKVFVMRLKNCLSLLQQKQNRGESSISQRQAIIKLIEKKIETKDTLKIGDPFLY